MSAKRVLGCCRLLMLCLLATSFCRGAEILKKGDAAPEFPEKAEWFGGSPCKLADFKDKKAVILYFLLPGCGSCDHFAPHLYRLALQNKDDVAIVGLTAHPKRQEVEEYAQKRLGDYPVLYLPEGDYVSRYIGEIKQFPYVVMIGKDGRIQWFGRGKFHDQVTDELERVLGKKAEPTDISAGKRFALVVSAPEGLGGTLKAPKAEGAAVAEALRKSGYETVVTLGAGGEKPATAENVKEELKKLFQHAGADDAVTFFFTGDGKQVNPGGEQRDIELLLEGGELALRDLHGAVAADATGKKALWVIDANQEDSTLPEWEDIGPAVGAGLPGVNLLLAAVRYDRSHLLAEDPAGTVFGKLFLAGLQDPCGRQNLDAFWRFVRDGMSDWTRSTGKGVLQSPFLSSPGQFSVLPPAAK